MKPKFKNDITLVFDSEHKSFKAYNQEHTWIMPDHYIEIETQEIEFQVESDITEKELLLKLVKTLEKKKKVILAEAEKKATDIDTKINSILMLTHTPEE